jgi:pyridoxine 5-phosphate synthase
MPILGVNIDHVATLREARGGIEPEPLVAASLAVLAGAEGITVHLREDRRHIKDRDLKLLKEFVPVELNLEMAATSEMIKIALSVKPDMATLVPEKRQELTTEGGVPIKKEQEKLKEAIKKLKAGGIPVSLFIDPDPESIQKSADAGADMVEIHTGYYANAKGIAQKARLKEVISSIEAALKAGLMVNAGHGLNYQNVKSVACIPGLRGLYIGHSIISRAVLVGLEKAVRQMRALIQEAVSGR